MIAIDDLNYWSGHLQTHPDVLTPNIDRIARAGMSFRHAYAAAPACNPSRTALLTGVRPTTSGVYFNEDEYLPALLQYGTLPEYLQNNGYRTLSTGKLFHLAQSNSRFFQQNYLPGGNYDSSGRLNGVPTLPDGVDWGPLEIEDDDTTPDFDKVNWAAEQLQRDFEDPFFLAVGLFRPHLPWYVPKRYFDLFPIEEVDLPPGALEGDLLDIPERGRVGTSEIHQKIVEAEAWQEGVQAYLASVAYADAAVGRIYDALLDSQYRDNTIVVLWGDHGWQLGEKERWRKFTLWSAASRTTLVFQVPGVTKGGTIVDTPVDLMSLYPTLLELAGLPANAQNEGVSILPLLRDPDMAWEAPAITTLAPEQHAVRRENWSYIHHWDGTEQLYDVAADPHEWINLADHADTESIRETFREILPR